VIDRVAALGFKLGQTTLSSYERGETVPTILMVGAIEIACDRPVGWVGIQAGLYAPPTSVPQLAAVDPELTDELRDSVVRAHDVAVKASRRARKASDEGQISLRRPQAGLK
jgi:hypothetical protein